MPKGCLSLLFIVCSIGLFGQSVDSILVDISDQQLVVYLNDGETLRYPTSTSKYGIGNLEGSNQTPLGVHVVQRKYGNDLAAGSILKGRVATGEIAPITQNERATGDDYVTSRILWLKGMEPGLNQGPGIDSFERYIYIHGTHEEGLIGQPASHGCIRMINDDVIELFEIVPIGTQVRIRP